VQHFRSTELNSSLLGFPAILLDHPDGSPVRPITNGRRSRPVGRYYSLKNGRALPWESRNELHALYHAEVSPTVLSYRVQPHKLKLVIDGVERFYTPDREEKLVGGQERIIEVKDAFEAENDPAYAEKIEHARAVYRLSGKIYCIQERQEIETQPLFDSVELIQNFRRTAVTARDILLLHDRFAGRETLALAEVRDLFTSAPLGFAKLCAMTIRRIIALDLTVKLGPTTAVRLLSNCK
jgi:hypothetical protein